MRTFILAIAAVVTAGVTAPTFVSQAQAQHAVVRPESAHGGWQRGHRANRSWMVNRGHGINRFSTGRRHDGMVRPGPGMHVRRY